jgi:YbbR domain-containing protein
VNWSAALTENWALKLTALGLALLLWSMLKAEAPTRVAVPEVPVHLEVRDPGWAVSGELVPERVTVTFLGPARELVRLAVERPRVVIPLEAVRDSLMVLPVDRRYVVLREGLDRSRIEDVRPGTIRASFQRMLTRAVPVSPVLRGAFADQLELGGFVVAEPASVRVHGPAAVVAALDSLRLQPVDVARIAAPGTPTFTVQVDTSGLGELEVTPARVQLRVPVVLRDAGPPLLGAPLGREVPRPEPPAEPEPVAAAAEDEP